MRKRFKKWSSKLLTGYGITAMFALALGGSILVTHSGPLFNLLAAISSFNGATTTVFFSPYGDTTLDTGGTTSIDITVDTKVPINALGATISFPKDSFEIVSISKQKSFFDLWTEDTSISEDSGEIHFSGGTTKRGGMVGTSTVITLMVKAKSPGTAQLRFLAMQAYPSNGTGNIIDTATYPISYTIKNPAGSVATPSPAGASISAPTPTTAQSSAPSADLNNDGKINLVDLSIMTYKLFRPYDARFDLNGSGSIGLDDLSILLSKI